MGESSTEGGSTERGAAREMPSEARSIPPDALQRARRASARDGASPFHPRDGATQYHESNLFEIDRVESDVLRAHAAEVHTHPDRAGYTVNDLTALPGNRLSQAGPAGALAGITLVTGDWPK